MSPNARRFAVGPFIASTLTPFVLGCAWGGYLFDNTTRPPAPCPSVRATGLGTGP